MSEVRLIDANALDDSFRDSIVKCKQWFEEASVLREKESTARAEQACVTFMECSMRLKKQPTVDAVPWEFLERYADWFCASVSFPEFIREAKAFYRSTAAMDGFTISDGERRTDEQQPQGQGL